MKFNNKDFVHFHVHGAYSRFDGLAKLNDLVMTARKMGFPALALTDHGSVMGWIEFLKLCKMTKDKNGNDISYPPIKAILGEEFYLSRKMNIGQYDNKKGVPKKNQPDGRKGNRHLNLFAMNFKGYQNICTLSQRSFTQGFYFDPRIDIELLSQHSEGVMCSTACLSNIVNAHLLNGSYDKAKKICGIFKDIFKENFFLEVMYHGIPGQRDIIPYIFQLSSELDILIVATNDVHYLKKEHGMPQEIWMCMSTNRCIKDPNRLHYQYYEFYLKSAEEMAKIFGDKPECLYNSVVLADRIDTDDIERNLFGRMRLPKFDIPSEYNDSYEYLCKLAWDGLKTNKWDRSQKHIDALKKELEDVRVAKENNNYDFATYFLIVQDYILKAKEMGAFIGTGRGSGYASVLLRCLGITYGIDPIGETGLIWERFLGFDNIQFIKDSDFGFGE